jgi:hypothetical protein
MCDLKNKLKISTTSKKAFTLELQIFEKEDDEKNKFVLYNKGF